MRKCVSVIAVLLVVCAGVFVISSGMSKRTNVVLVDYTLSEDGSAVTLRTSIPSSMGYIRDMAVEQAGGELHCSFYNAFGGFNSRLGARDTFTLPLDDSWETICFDRGGGRYEPVLSRSGTEGRWTVR